MRAKSSAMPRSNRISHVLAHIMTPAPISLNCPAASYKSTCMSTYLDNATASVKPPIPPPLRASVRRVSPRFLCHCQIESTYQIATRNFAPIFEVHSCTKWGRKASRASVSLTLSPYIYLDTNTAVLHYV